MGCVCVLLMTSECGMDGIAARHDEWTIALKFQFFPFFFLFYLACQVFIFAVLLEHFQTSHPTLRLCVLESHSVRKGAVPKRERDKGERRRFHIGSRKENPDVGDKMSECHVDSNSVVLFFFFRLFDIHGAFTLGHCQLDGQ